MIDRQFVERMARYNRWQNRNLYDSADRLSDEERARERGAFFGSIHGTLDHLLWGDRIWMHRFAGTQKPAGGIKESTDAETTRDSGDGDPASPRGARPARRTREAAPASA